MTTTDRINHIKLLLKRADADLLAKIEYLLETKVGNATKTQLTDLQKKELNEQEAKYEAGEGQNFSWQEIKQELIDRYGLPG